MQVETLIRLLIVSLAAYRLARMVAVEDGPLDIFSRWRGWYDPAQVTWVGRGINCPLCAGFWVSPLLLLVSYVDYVNFVVLWLAVAGLQTALQKQER